MKLIGASLLMAMAWVQSTPEPQWGGPEWLGDLDTAFAVAAEKARPLLIVFR